MTRSLGPTIHLKMRRTGPRSDEKRRNKEFSGAVSQQAHKSHGETGSDAQGGALRKQIRLEVLYASA